MRKAKLVEKSFNTIGYIFAAFSLLFFAVSYLRYDPAIVTGLVSMAGLGTSYLFFTVGSLIAEIIALRSKNRKKQLNVLTRARIRAKKRIISSQNEIARFAAGVSK